MTAIPAETTAGSDLLVETHFASGAFTGLALAQYFQNTHEITVIRQSEIQPEEVRGFQSLAPLNGHLVMLDYTTAAPWLWMRGLQLRY